MAFQINATPPPDGGVPIGNGYRYILPEALGVDGNGLPCGAVGYPSVEVSFERLNASAWDWYKDFTLTAPSVALTSLQVWNPYAATPGWTTYSSSAVMHRPTYEGISGGYYLGVKILFTRLS